jgi:hypothetical protein
VLLASRLASAAQAILIQLPYFEWLDFITYVFNNETELSPFLALVLCGVYMVTRYVTNGLPIFSGLSRDTLESCGSLEPESLLSDHLSEDSEE